MSLDLAQATVHSCGHCRRAPKRLKPFIPKIMSEKLDSLDQITHSVILALDKSMHTIITLR